MARVDGKRLRELAKAGAEAELARLRAEVAALESAFPELKRSGKPKATSGAERSRRRPKMSAVARKAVSARMRKYWAERKAKSTAK